MASEKVQKMGKLCIPGMRLSVSNEEYSPGPGTYELRGYIYATLCGVLKMEQDENKVYIQFQVVCVKVLKVESFSSLLTKVPSQWYVYCS